MSRSNDPRHWATLTILALAAGSAAAAEGQNPGHAAIEVVEVVEKSRPAPVSTDDYFAPLVADLKATLGEELRRNVAISAMTGYQLLAAELELSNGTRVAADDTALAAGSDAQSLPAKGT